MGRLKKLQNRRAALVKAMRTLSDGAEADNERAFSPEEQAEYDRLKVELAETDQEIAREQSLVEMERSLIPEESDQRSRRNNREPVIVDHNQQRADQQPWASFGEFLQAVAAAGMTGRVDPRLVQPAAATGLGESVGSEGGFLVQTDFVSTLMARTYANSQILNGGPGYAGVSRVPLGANSNGVKIPAVNETSRVDGSRWGGVQAYWAAEGGTKTASKPDFRQVDLNLKKLIGLCYSTDELLADASALEAILTLAFSEEFAFKIQDSLINGTGAGHPLGILNAACLVSVAKESGQAAATIVTENINKMYARLWARGMSRSVWLINQDCWPQLFALKDAASNAIYLGPNGIAGVPFGTLRGRPVVPIEQCQTIGTKGDIYFADWAEYLFIDKGTMESAQSIHVKFTTDETAFRFVYRCDGQPAWNAAVTPFKGSNKQSPFISLDTR